MTSDRRTARLDPSSDRWWTLVAPVYDRAVALVGWHRWQHRLVGGIGSGTILDVGCGPAHLARRIVESGASYVGLDRNAAMLDRAARRLARIPGRRAVVRAEITALPFPDGSFDVVVATGVLGLLDLSARRAALREMARVARREVRLLEPVHRPGRPLRSRRARLIALVRTRPVEPAELLAAGLTPTLRGRPRLAGVYTAVHAVKTPHIRGIRAERECSGGTPGPMCSAVRGPRGSQPL